MKDSLSVVCFIVGIIVGVGLSAMIEIHSRQPEVEVIKAPETVILTEPERPWNVRRVRITPEGNAEIEYWKASDMTLLRSDFLTRDEVSNTAFRYIAPFIKSPDPMMIVSDWIRYTDINGELVSWRREGELIRFTGISSPVGFDIDPQSVTFYPERNDRTARVLKWNSHAAVSSDTPVKKTTKLGDCK